MVKKVWVDALIYLIFYVAMLWGEEMGSGAVIQGPSGFPYVDNKNRANQY